MKKTEDVQKRHLRFSLYLIQHTKLLSKLLQKFLNTPEIYVVSEGSSDCPVPMTTGHGPPSEPNAFLLKCLRINIFLRCIILK